MTTFALRSLVALPLFALFTTAGLTELARRLSLRLQFVSKVKKDRWNPRVVPMGGGIAIDIALLVGIAILDTGLFVDLAPPIILLAILGLVDDLLELPPIAKLSGQAIAAFYAIWQGYVFPFEWGALSVFASLIWMLFVTNALNLTDNMDGLASGLVAITGFFLAALFAHSNAELSYSVLSLMISGAAIGFLLHNRYPARIFMGDIGSLPLGFLAAVLALKIQVTSSSTLTPYLLPVLVVLVPSYDALLVMSLRALSGRNIMLGNVDHLSHRLVRAGFSDKSSVAVLYGLAFLGGVGAHLILYGWMAVALAAIAISLFLLTTFLFVEEVRSPIAEQLNIPMPFRAFALRASEVWRDALLSLSQRMAFKLPGAKD